MGKLRYFIEQSWLLIVASFVFGLLLAATNYALEPVIRQNRTDKLNRLAKGLLPAAEHFVDIGSEVEIESGRGQSEQITVYRAVANNDKCVGWSFNIGGSGFADRIDLVVAVDAAFEKFAGYDVLASNETPGFGDKIKNDYYRGQFKGAPVGRLKVLTTGNAEKIDSEIIAISGATISSEAVVAIMNGVVGQIRERLLAEGLIDVANAEQRSQDSNSDTGGDVGNE
ncbi:MAG: FMN-binding protein [Sedimentisphaerales bacterium]|nr:FMN-binding protein [Sedimentisphaerales bacterium]